jgi:hypothetical protein
MRSESRYQKDQAPAFGFQLFNLKYSRCRRLAIKYYQKLCFLLLPQSRLVPFDEPIKVRSHQPFAGQHCWPLDFRESEELFSVSSDWRDIMQIIRRTVVAILGLGLVALFAPKAHASLVFSFTVTPASINVGQSALLDLHVTGTPDSNIAATNSFIVGANLTFSTGDGQTFVLFAPIFSLQNNPIDFQHTFIYPTAGGFAPEVAGSVEESEPDAADVAFFSRAVDLTSSLQVNPVMTGVRLWSDIFAIDTASAKRPRIFG